MSLLTTHYSMFKPEFSDPADITKMNPNWDTIDEELRKINDYLASLSWSDIEAEKKMWDIASDLHEVETSTFVRWNAGTLNTPYTDGLTSADTGSCYVSANDNKVRTIYVFTTSIPVPRVFAQSCEINDGVVTWNDWIDVSSIGERPYPAISEDGINYTVTIPGIVELYNGLEIMVVPNMSSTQTNISLNLNGLGNKYVRMTLPFSSGNSGTLAKVTGWFSADAPMKIRYHEKMNTWKSELQRQSAQNLYGVVPIESGGTGADNIEDALKNLDVPSRTEINTIIENSAKAVYGTVTIPVASWVEGDNGSCTIDVSNTFTQTHVPSADEDVIIFVAPAPTTGNIVEWGTRGVYCSAHKTGTLTFISISPPTMDIVANVSIMGGTQA